MTMKKKMLFMMAVLAMVCLTANAQHFGRNYSRSAKSGYYRSSVRPVGAGGHFGYNPVSYVGLRVGGSFASLGSDGMKYDTSTKSGLDLGVVAGFSVSPYIPLYFETGAKYTEKGGKTDAHKFNLDYLEMPLVLKFVHVTDGGVGIQPYAGGYLALGVGGKISDKILDGPNVHYNASRSAFGDKGDFQRFDGGLKIGCGFSYDVLYADVSYERGLSNITDGYDSTHNSALMLSVGLNF